MERRSRVAGAAPVVGVLVYPSACTASLSRLLTGRNRIVRTGRLTFLRFVPLHTAMQNSDPNSTNPGREGASRDPLHGVTLEKILQQLVDRYGWKELGQRIDIRCFNFDPSIKSSLTFLRRTPWARAKVEALYIETVRSS